MCIVGATDSERKLLKRRCRAGELIHVYATCYARTEYWNSCSQRDRYMHLTRTYAQLHPNWVFCDMTSATIWGINESQRHFGHLHILNTRAGHTTDYGRITHHFSSQSEYVTIEGIRVTPMGRTAFDCARRYEFPDGLAVVESLLRQRLISKRKLAKLFDVEPGRHRAQALRCLTYAEGKTENGGEAYSLGVMLDEEFAPPLVQFEIPYPLPVVSRHGIMPNDRVDFAWKTDDGRLIVAELDGRIKYRDPSMYKNGSLPDTIIAEKEREERIRLVADEVVRFSFAEAMKRQVLVRKLITAGVPKVTAQVKSS